MVCNISCCVSFSMKKSSFALRQACFIFEHLESPVEVFSRRGADAVSSGCQNQLCQLSCFKLMIFAGRSLTLSCRRVRFLPVRAA